MTSVTYSLLMSCCVLQVLHTSHGRLHNYQKHEGHISTVTLIQVPEKFVLKSFHVDEINKVHQTPVITIIIVLSITQLLTVICPKQEYRRSCACWGKSVTWKLSYLTVYKHTLFPLDIFKKLGVRLIHRNKPTTCFPQAILIIYENVSSKNVVYLCPALVSFCSNTKQPS